MKTSTSCDRNRNSLKLCVCGPKCKRLWSWCGYFPIPIRDFKGTLNFLHEGIFPCAEPLPSRYMAVSSKFCTSLGGGSEIQMSHCSTFFLVVVARLTRAMTITAHADRVLGNISPYMVGAGIEDVNHELIGGIYTQMLWGESFEEASMSSSSCCAQRLPCCLKSVEISSNGTNGKPTYVSLYVCMHGCYVSCTDMHQTTPVGGISQTWRLPVVFISLTIVLLECKARELPTPRRWKQNIPQKIFHHVPFRTAVSMVVGCT